MGGLYDVYLRCEWGAKVSLYKNMHIVMPLCRKSRKLIKRITNSVIHIAYYIYKCYRFEWEVEAGVKTCQAKGIGCLVDRLAFLIG